MATHSVRYQALLGKLRQARKDAGLTQQEVVAALRKYRNYVTKVESGERRIDPIELQDFAKLYHRPLRHFLGE